MRVLFGLWEGAGVPEGNPRRHRENMQTPRRKEKKKKTLLEIQTVHDNRAAEAALGEIILSCQVRGSGRHAGIRGPLKWRLPMKLQAAALQRVCQPSRATRPPSSPPHPPPLMLRVKGCTCTRWGAWLKSTKLKTPTTETPSQLPIYYFATTGAKSCGDPLINPTHKAAVVNLFLGVTVWLCWAVCHLFLMFNSSFWDTNISVYLKLFL